MPNLPPSHNARTPEPRQPDRRPSAAKRGYGRAWRALAAAYLGEHPLCVDCAEVGLTMPAEHVDHRIPREAGGSDDPSNLQGLCRHHHSKKTAKHDGGFGRPRR